MKAQEWKFEPDPKYPLGEGEWSSEPDKMQWVDEGTGLPCLIVRNRMGGLCGYVGVSSGHPFYEKDYNARVPVADRGSVGIGGNYSILDLFCESMKEDDGCVSLSLLMNVHGGLTYADRCQESGEICHIVEEGEDDAVWWFGFDCGHAGDLLPSMDYLRKNNPVFSEFHDSRDVYRNLEYVKGQVAHLAKQLKGYAV